MFFIRCYASVIKKKGVREVRGQIKDYDIKKIRK